jgi:acyl-CoA thioesterase
MSSCSDDIPGIARLHSTVAHSSGLQAALYISDPVLLRIQSDRFQAVPGKVQYIHSCQWQTKYALFQAIGPQLPGRGYCRSEAMGQFALDTAVVRVEEQLWRGELRPGWLSGTVPQGGYVLAVAGRALSEALPHRDPLAVSAFYLAPTVLGPVECRVETLRQGRSTTHAMVRMYQAGELKVQVTAAYTDLGSLDGADWTADPRPQIPPFESCQPGGQQKVEVFRERIDLRLANGVEVFTRREPDGSGEFRGWLAHRDGADPDCLSLLMFADACPPPVFNALGPQRWVPTIELAVQVRAYPAPGPLQMRFLSRYLSRGILEEDGELWDSQGQLVAISRQSAKLRLHPKSPAALAMQAAKQKPR